VRFCLRVFACALVVLIVVAETAVVFGQTAPTRHETVNSVDSEAILKEFAPDTIPLDSLHPKPANRARAIRLLLAVKHQETGWNRQQAVYLLALLGYEYYGNRDELLRVWHHCVVKDDDENCNEMTAMTLIGLYHQGHKELLGPLLARCRFSDGALSEELFPFYAEELGRNPNDFLAALTTFSPKEQQGVCKSAAWDSDDGTSPNALHKILQKLNRAGGVIAVRCAGSYEAGVKVTEDNSSDPPAGPRSKN